MSDTKQRWGWRTNPIRVAVLCVLAFVLSFLVVTGAETLFAKDAHAVDCFGVGPAGCEPVHDVHRNVAEKINNGTWPKSRDSFDMRAAFSEPKKVREVIQQRIKTGMIAQQGTAQGDQVACCIDGAAAAAYLTLVDNPGCGAVNENESTLEDQFNSDMMCRFNNMPDPEGPGEYINAEEAKKVATVFFCGSSLALAVGLSGASGGATAAIAISGIGGCTMAVWD